MIEGGRILTLCGTNGLILIGPAPSIVAFPSHPLLIYRPCVMVTCSRLEDSNASISACL